VRRFIPVIRQLLTTNPEGTVMADNKDDPKVETKDGQPTVDGAEPQVDKAIHEETAQGFRGTRTDPTPLEHYTVDGVIAGKPTPETDDAAAEAAHAARRGR
jgi:hypothetical protein